MTASAVTLSTITTATTADTDAAMLIPLNKLKKSPCNARKTPHTEAHVEALAASIAAKGMLQNLVVEPETGKDGEPTGSYFVTIGEGRRLAHLLLAKRKEIKKSAAIRCVLDTVNDAHEISLDENVTREAMHPADQFEAFRVLAEERGLGAEEIAARFGVTAHVVKQRLRLGNISPRLMQLYRDGDLTLDQLKAFALTDNHIRQEQVYDNLSYNRDPSQIRRELTRSHVAPSDRRAVFVGAELYEEAGGVILRDLFSETGYGYFQDAALLDRLALEKLQTIADEVREREGWKWTSAHIDFPSGHGLRRTYPGYHDLSEEDEAADAATREEYDAITEQYDSVEELPDDIDERLGKLEAAMERIDAKRAAYDADDIARGGAFVVLSYDGTARIERGFIRPEDEAPEPEEETPAGEEVGTNRNEGVPDTGQPGTAPESSDHEDEGDALKPISDTLTRELSAYRTQALRLALAPHPDRQPDELHVLKVGRLRKLETLGLAEQIGPGQWVIREEAAATLRGLGERGDIIKRIHRELTERGIERAVTSYVLSGESLDDPVIGRLIARGLDDEMKETAYAIVDGVDGRTHHLKFPNLDAAGDGTPGSIVELRKFEDAQGRRRIALAVRADLPLEQQITAQGVTWLDRQAVARNPTPLRESGFGAEVRQALDKRAEHLIEHGFAARRGQRIVSPVICSTNCATTNWNPSLKNSPPKAVSPTHHRKSVSMSPAPSASASISLPAASP